MLFLLKIAIFLAVFVLSVHVWLKNKSYVFTEEAVAKIALKYVGEYRYLLFWGFRV